MPQHSTDGPFTDDAVRHLIDVHNTQLGIQAFIRKAVEIMAEAGRASQKALRHAPEYAIDRWCDVLRDEAKRLVREAEQDRREPKTLVEVQGMLKLEGPK